MLLLLLENDSTKNKPVASGAAVPFNRNICSFCFHRKLYDIPGLLDPAAPLTVNGDIQIKRALLLLSN